MLYVRQAYMFIEVLNLFLGRQEGTEKRKR